LKTPEHHYFPQLFVSSHKPITLKETSEDKDKQQSSPEVSEFQDRVSILEAKVQSTK
jgi:uncharacterized protein YqfB (UPF0267 family)